MRDCQHHQDPQPRHQGGGGRGHRGPGGEQGQPLDIIYSTIRNIYTGDPGHGGVRGRGGGVGGAAGLSLRQAPARDHLHHPDRGIDIDIDIVTRS